MREISPAENMSVENFLKMSDVQAREHVSTIRKQKKNGLRPKPSTCLIDKSVLLDKIKRLTLLDKVASFVDENLFGRSEMCIQFADLLQRALAYLQIPAKSIIGNASYNIDGKEVFQWQHAWVQINDEIIDGNVDSAVENPFVPKELDLKPYWGPVANIPSDRKLQEDISLVFPYEKDVADIWWPELKTWIDEMN